MDGANTQTGSVAEAFLRALKRRGVDHVLANAGTDFAPVIEALVALAGRGEPMPRFLTIPHENLAVAMAHGYYQMAGKPAGVMVHVTVGTGNTVCALMNAARDNVPLLLMAGRTPHTQVGHIASRSAPIHWGQENFDQAGMVREYTKWDYELRAGQPVDEIVGRALDVALAQPRGPVYLTLPREVLADRDQVASQALPPTDHAAPQPSAKHIGEIAKLLARAELPVIVTANVGRDFGAVGALAALAERYAIPVAQPHASCVNLPASHPMNLGHAGTELVAKADLIIVAECEVPWYPRYVTPRADARVVHPGTDPLYARYPIRSFPAEIVVPGNTRAALELLDAALADASVNQNAIKRRRGTIAELKAAQARAAAATLEQARGEKPIRYAYLGDCLRAALPKKSTVVVELGVPPDSLQLEEPGSLLGVSIGGGLGFGLGASLGAKLAAPDRMIVTRSATAATCSAIRRRFISCRARRACRRSRSSSTTAAGRRWTPQRASSIRTGSRLPRSPCRSSSFNRRRSSRKWPRHPTGGRAASTSRPTCRDCSTKRSRSSPAAARRCSTCGWSTGSAETLNGDIPHFAGEVFSG